MEFVQDAWNWFDFIVVAVSLISLVRTWIFLARVSSSDCSILSFELLVMFSSQVFTDLPGADVLRLLRCFRVFRLFKRIASLVPIPFSLTLTHPLNTLLFSWAFNRLFTSKFKKGCAFSCCRVMLRSFSCMCTAISHAVDCWHTFSRAHINSVKLWEL